MIEPIRLAFDRDAPPAHAFDVIEHRGREALGADGENWRDRNHGG